jgi:hypothetical protein
MDESMPSELKAMEAASDGVGAGELHGETLLSFAKHYETDEIHSGEIFVMVPSVSVRYVFTWALMLSYVLIIIWYCLVLVTLCIVHATILE